MKHQLEHVWSVLCEKSVTDNETNNLSFHNIIEVLQIQHESLPASADRLEKGVLIPLQFEMVSLWRKRVAREEKVEATVRIELIDPLGKVLQELKHDISVEEGSERFRWRAKINGLPVTSPGEYTFKVYIGETGSDAFEEVGHTYLDVKMSMQQKNAD